MSFTFRSCDPVENKAVLELFHLCKDYFDICNEELPENTDEFFWDLPPGKKSKDKHTFALEHKSHIIGVADLVRDFPCKGTWITGLLILAPDYRKIGLGSIFRTLICNFALSQNANTHRIGVLKQNKNALSFWKNQGYDLLATTSEESILRLELKLIHT